MVFSTSGGFSKQEGVSAETPPHFISAGVFLDSCLEATYWGCHSHCVLPTRRMIIRVPLRSLLRPSRLLSGNLRSVETEAGYHAIADETFDALCEGLERIEDKFDAIDHSYSVLWIFFSYLSLVYLLARSS